jgi:hypothetical protein
LFITRACPAVPKLLGVSVKSFIDILASWNVPKPTTSTTSPFVKAEANTKEVPEVAVTSEPKTCLTPLR